ncbi:MAG: hypothetical protein K2W86_13070 [Sphingomonas sp.]|uniref:hypothetical protein n=1 Tax=Sphingomonas sp. TaxID=28214 RepID=UPI0035A84041|nr:hypothetical protein [Sphingomonas sp.]
MALAMRGEADRAEFIRYTDSLEVPSSWREGPLKISLGGDLSYGTIETVVVTTKQKMRDRAVKQGARPAVKPVIKAVLKKRAAKSGSIIRGGRGRLAKGKKTAVETE